MKRVTIHEAKTTLSKLLLLVSSGTPVEIARGGVPVARIVPIESAKRRRQPDRYKGKVSVSCKFDTPLPDTFKKHFR